MQGRYFKKFVGMNSIFSVQTNAIIAINNLADTPFVIDEKVFYKEGSIVAYMFQSDIDRIRKFVFTNLSTNPSYLNDIYKNTTIKFDDFNEKHDQRLAEIDGINEARELRKWIKKFLDEIIDMQSPAYLAELFVGYDEFWPNYVGISKNDFDILMTPEELSYSKEYDFALSCIKLGKSKMTIKELISKYYWVRGNYSEVKPLIESDIVFDLEKMTVSEAENHYKETQDYIPSIIEKKKDIWNKIKDDSLRSLVSAISSFIVLQDKRKAIIQKTSFIFLKAVNKLLDLYDCDDEEKKIIVSAGYPPWFVEMEKGELLEMSREAFKCFYLPFSGKILVGDEALKIYKEEEEKEFRNDNLVKGKTAFAGVATGKVRIILATTDFDKFVEGEILVTFMTRPEFVPLIKKSAGVITDEGGITCHAAIVTRELKKPCIIGTRNATSILKDGDLVEVDANNGVVKILKKNE